jgi:hypothetical protein
MKKIFFILITVALAFTACDYVQNPYPQTNSNAGDAATCDTPTFPSISTHIRRILLEDYTGHTCGNCPKAAVELKYCDSVYAGKIIPLAIHVGYFAEPCPPHALPSGAPAGSFAADYRTTVGNDYDNVFKAGPSGLPLGMINRREFDATNLTHLKLYQSHGWANYIGTFVNDPPVADIQIINDYNITSRKLCTAIKSEFLTATTGQYKLVVLLTQDSIIDWQVDYRYSPDIIANYKHQHMLRDAINSTWGDEIANGTIASGNSYISKYAYNIPTNFNNISTDPHHMHVVAFIYNVATYEVLQAAEAKVLE